MQETKSITGIKGPPYVRSKVSDLQSLTFSSSGVRSLEKTIAAGADMKDADSKWLDGICLIKTVLLNLRTIIIKKKSYFQLGLFLPQQVSTTILTGDTTQINPDERHRCSISEQFSNTTSVLQLLTPKLSKIGIIPASMDAIPADINVWSWALVMLDIIGFTISIVASWAILMVFIIKCIIIKVFIYYLVNDPRHLELQCKVCN